VKGSAKG